MATDNTDNTNKRPKPNSVPSHSVSNLIDGLSRLHSRLTSPVTIDTAWKSEMQQGIQAGDYLIEYDTQTSVLPIDNVEADGLAAELDDALLSQTNDAEPEPTSEGDDAGIAEGDLMNLKELLGDKLTTMIVRFNFF